MSHFSVLIVTKEAPCSGSLRVALQPWHEYECTDTNDEFIQDVDITEEVEELMRGEEPETLEGALGYYSLEDRTVNDESEVEKTGDGPHKWGYAIVKDGKLIKAVVRTNPNKKWDWWMVGGRWGGKLLDKKDGLRGDIVKKCNLDVEKLEKEAAEKAAKDYDEVHAVIAGRPVPKWPEIRELHGVEKGREIYGNDPVIVDIRKKFSPFMELEKYAIPKEEYVEIARKNAFSTFAIIMNGKWLEKGDMGWWGCVSDEKSDWPDIFQKAFAEIPEDHWLTIVDCHI